MVSLILIEIQEQEQRDFIFFLCSVFRAGHRGQIRVNNACENLQGKMCKKLGSRKTLGYIEKSIMCLKYYKSYVLFFFFGKIE